MARPRPIPWTRLVTELSSRVKGSKIVSMSSGAMPMPSSLTVKRRETKLARGLGVWTRSNSTVPPSGVYFTALVMMLMRTWLMRSLSPTTRPSRTPETSTRKSWPLARARGLAMVNTSSASSESSNSERLRVVLPLSILDMSRTSLSRPSMCREEAWILRVWSRTRSGSPASRRRSVARPTMAFMGVRMSWLTLDRNVLLDSLATSATERASRSTSSSRRSRVWSNSTAMQRRPPSTFTSHGGVQGVVEGGGAPQAVGRHHAPGAHELAIGQAVGAGLDLRGKENRVARAVGATGELDLGPQQVLHEGEPVGLPPRAAVHGNAPVEVADPEGAAIGTRQRTHGPGEAGPFPEQGDRLTEGSDRPVAHGRLAHGPSPHLLLIIIPVNIF